MSLTYKDLQAIRAIVKETIDPLKGEMEALSNDVKEVYENASRSSKEYDH